MKQLVIIRGNSASGKTTVATLLQKRLGRHTMLLSQDVVRRQILRVSDKQKHPATKLMAEMARFGWTNGWRTVIIEGILNSEKDGNGNEMRNLIKESDRAFVYYFDIPFDETLRRHATKPNADDYGEKEMRQWWRDKDQLSVDGEVALTAYMDQDAIVERIVSDVRNITD